MIVGFFWALVSSAGKSEVSNQNILDLGKQNNTYLRATACIIAVPVEDRTNQLIDECYNQAERFNNTKVDRFKGQFK